VQIELRSILNFAAILSGSKEIFLLFTHPEF